MGVIRKKPKPKVVINYPPITRKKWIPPDQLPKKKPEPKYIKPEGISQKLQISSLTKVWHQFRVLGEIAIITGSFSQFCRRFSFKTNGYQGSANCVIACVFAYLYPMPEWTSIYLDRILMLGDLLYQKSVQETANRCLKDLPIEKVFNSFYMANTKISVTIEITCKSCEKVNTGCVPKIKLALIAFLDRFFQCSSSGVLRVELRNYSAIWFTANAYYLFNPGEHDCFGKRWDGNCGCCLGRSLLVRSKTIDGLVNLLVDNMQNTNNPKFEIVPCFVERVVTVNILPPENMVELHPGGALDSCSITSLTEQVEAVVKDKKKPLEEPVEEEVEEESEEPPPPELDEISPDVGDDFSLTKRPSWFQEGQTLVKKECSATQIPAEPVRAEVLSFYVEIIPNIFGILRGGTCQTDPRFSKYLGKQSLGNAISTLILLRIYKAKVWVPKMIDKVLKYGDLIYQDAMLSIPKTKPLQITDFARKTIVEQKIFVPEIEEYAAIGKLQSQESEVLDLLPALETFLTDNECCIILGPVILAVWVEDGFFFMFDPNERDNQGKMLPKTKPVLSSEVFERVPGVACVTWFKHLKDLVDLYMANLEKEQKLDQFFLSKVQINDYLAKSEPWNNFLGLSNGNWILQGTISQASRNFDSESRNFQCTANSAMAIAFQILNNVKEWCAATVDEVLKAGDEYYKASVQNLQDQGKFTDKMLLMSELNKVFNFENVNISFTIDDCIINGVIDSKNDEDVINLTKGLQNFFADNKSGVVTSHNTSVAIWQTDDVFYCFDPHSRDEKGLTTGYGTACVIRSLKIEDLAASIEANLMPGKQDFFNITRVAVEFFDNSEGVARPPINNYKSIDYYIAILRATLSEVSEKYKTNVGKQTVPMCLTAMGFNRLRPATIWTFHDLDEIIDKGDELYIQSVIQNDEEEQQGLLEEFEGGEEAEHVEEAPKTPEPAVTRKGAGFKPSDTPAKPEPEPIIDNAESYEGDSLLTEPTEFIAPFKITSANVKKDFVIGLNKLEVEFEDYDEGNVHEKLQESLQGYFEQERIDENMNQEIILETDLLTVGMWRDDNVFYMFDPKPRDPEGQVIGKQDWSEYIPTPEEIDYFMTDFGEEGEETDQGEYDGILNTEATEMMDPLASGDARDMSILGEEMGEEEDIPVIMKKSLSYWAEQEKLFGYGCVMWFAKLDELIEHVFENIPPIPRRVINFTLKTITIKNTPIVKDKFHPEEDERNDVFDGSWFNFEEVEHGRWILRGTMNLCNLMFPAKNRGKQSIPTCCTALAFVFIFPWRCLKNTSVDRILSYGDKLFTFVKRWKKSKLKNSPEIGLNCDELDRIIYSEDFEIEDMVKKFCIYKNLINMEIIPEVISGDINAQNFEEVLDVTRGLEQFLQEDTYCLLQAKDLTVAVWKGVKVFYMFDPNNRGPNGVKSSNGTACITRFLTLETLSEVFLKNVSRVGKNAFHIHKVTISKDECVRIREPVIEEKPAKIVTKGGFHNVLPGKCIVRGTMSHEDPKFETTKPQALSAPTAVIALTMSLIHKPDTWSKPIVDEILNLGADLYDESILALGYDFNPWEDSMDIYRVKNDFCVGVIKANCELRNMDQTGIIDIKSPDTQNLRKGLEKFFEENTHGVLTTEPLTVAIWEEEQPDEQPLIYMFDPYARGPVGMPLLNGTACVVTFVNAKVAADHIIGCILDAEKRQGEYTIVPVEIVVGKTRTKLKCEKAKTVSDVNVLPRCSKLMASEEKKKLRKIAEDERKRKEAKRIYMMGRIGYYTISPGEALIRSLRSQTSTNYSSDSRGNQDIPNCIVAIVMHRLVTVDCWNHKHLDVILDTGDQVYIDSFIAYNPKNKKLGVENVLRKFFLTDIQVHITIYKAIISDLFTVGNLYGYLSSYFQQEQFCMISYLDQWVSVFFKAGYFYLFDPHDRDREGNKVSDGFGWAVCLRFDEIQSLALKLVGNLTVDFNASVKMFSMWLIAVDNK